MSIPNIQLAFQGGGAKFAVMLPVADAFVTAQKRGDLQIKAVAGTSAGAICAALVACDADFSKVLDFLDSQGDGWVSKLIPADIRPLAELKSLPKWWHLRTWFKHRNAILDVVWAGRPVLNGNALRDFFRALFKFSTGRDDHAIENRTTALTIIASNIVASAAVEHKKGSLVSALTDSCALPIIFRSFASLAGSHHVDGGLCDNLPIEGLLADVASPVFAIYPVSPEKEPSTTNNIFTYLLALLSASINHGVSRSKAKIEAPFQFEQKTELGLLDFREALAVLRDKKWYKEEKDAALARIENFLTSYGSIASPKEARVVDVIDVDQYRNVLDELSSDFAGNFEQTLSRFMIRINCDKFFRDKKDAARRPADTVTRVSEVKVLGDDVRYYRSNLLLSGTSIVPTIWSVRNQTRDRDIPIRALALEDRSDHKAAKHCLIQFIDPKAHLSKGDILEIRGTYPTSHPNDMSDLNFQKTEFFGFNNLEWDDIQTAELVLVYPKKIGPFNLSSDPKRSTRHDLTAMQFGKEFRAALDNEMEVQGRSAKNLKKGQKLYALVTRIPQ
ncbi:putative acylesterase/phospholipase RssA [Bradyrhizobium sp. LM6.10]